MKIMVSDALKQHLQHRNKRNIVVEVATSDRSDFDVTEIFIRLCDYSHRDYLKEKKGYREYPIEGIPENHMAVLFKPYRLELEEEIYFDLVKKWIFNKIVYSGIKL
ncbi:MAG: hypothetical protein J5928_02945 [Firmicutes bacterium]|nr:hypothetical protein [Bacillota bacterium]